MKRLLLCLLSLGLLAGAAAADDNHYINIFIGERAAGLGGAYTAIADGPEGAYYNPAGLAFCPSSYFSLSTNAVQFKRLTYLDIWPGASEQVDYVRDTFAFIPNFFGIIQKQEKFTTAFTISTLDSEAYDQRDKIVIPRQTTDGTSLGDQIVNVNFNHSRSLQEIGPSVAFLLGTRFSLGAGIFADYTDSKYINQNVISFTEHDIFQISSVYSRSQVFSVRPQVGLQWSITDTLVVGYSVTAPLPVFGVYTSQSTSYLYYADDTITLFGLPDPYAFGDNFFVADNTVSYQNIFSNALFESTYLKNSIGVAYFASKSLLFSADGYLYLPLESTTRPANKVLTWNAALGAEWYINPYFPLRVGLFTNNANTPRIDAGDLNQDDHLNLYGASLSVGYTTADFGINVGTTASLGLGDAQLISNSAAIQQVRGLSVQVFISGGYQY